MALPHAVPPPGPLSDAEKIRAAVARFGSELAPRMRGDGRLEDRLRSPVHNLVADVGVLLGREVVVHDEVTLIELSSRPDFAVDTAGGRVGYIELKAPGKGVPGNWQHATKHDRDQWKKLGGLPNIVYTDGTLWGLYRKGVLVDKIARLDGDLYRSGLRLKPADDSFQRLITNFLCWAPERPTDLRKLVAEVAPLCRLLRDQVAETMAYEGGSPGKRPFTTLAGEWRSILFPTLTDGEFADAYAQAVTFALLLARLDGIAFDRDRSLNDIAEQLSKQHSLMGEALSILTNPRWVRHLSVVEMLRRVVGNIDWSHIHLGDTGAYGLLYETFLAEYDPKLRRKSGTYYTPDPVARAMVGFTDHVLKTRLKKRRGFAADDVIVVDPAMGTGTFLVEIIDSVVATLRDERASDAVPETHLRELFAKRLVGFELQAGPYSVAELRLHHILKTRYGVEVPREEVRFLSNALDDPDTLALDFGQLYDVLKEAREGANRIKRNSPVMVVIGNPPWREHARGDAPWLEKTRDPKLIPPDLQSRPSLDEFRAHGQGRRAFNLSNMWTFFWRWATWKVFDANPDDPAGVVTLITPKAYLTSESHAGMRRYLRETADEGWIVDVTPEGYQPDVPTRLFPGVQQPICIGVFARYGPPDRTRPARIHHMAISGTQQQKFDQLSTLRIDTARWRDASDGWEAPLQPADEIWSSCPTLTDLMPWHHPGMKPNRNWVYAPDEETLRMRWSVLVHAADGDKAELFKETRDRSIARRYPPVPGVPSFHRPLQEETDDPVIVRAAFRSFDRQYVIRDRRAIDFPRPELWRAQSDEQVYAFQTPPYRYTGGPAVTFSALVPNTDYFMGHHGGQVLPLFREAGRKNPNVTPNLLKKLSSFVGTPVSPEDLLAYIAAVVAHPAYTSHFAEQLTTPGVSVPLTMDNALWLASLEIGRELLWLHTYGERYVDEANGRPHGCILAPEDKRPRLVEPIPASPAQMPDEIRYDATTETLIIGEETLFGRCGRIERVSPAVWDYTVGEMKVVRKWFGYRQRRPRHKRRTSPLDNINPTRWTPQFEDELLELLNVLSRCVALEPRQAELFEQILTGPLITVEDLNREGIFPVPAESRKAPRRTEASGTLGLELLE